ncbi:MAG TPA: AraC family transcriptional regulator [Cyclobacteriaceae bacterium]|nr:AraC family transcriptional regulator [Cyclobacteriaceae bacterium]
MTFYHQNVERISLDIFPRAYLVKRIMNAKLFIDGNYSDPINLDIIAREAFLSKFHFTRLFKQIYGCTPHQYLTSVRIKKAKGLLRSGFTVKEACLSVGFNSVTTFNGLYKKATGNVPGSARRFSK